LRRRFGRQRTGGGGRGFGGTLGLMIGAVGLGALIFFLLRRSRGDDVRESVERASETVRSGAEDSRREESESPAGQEGATAEGDAEGRRQTVRRFTDRLQEQRPTDQKQGQEAEESSEGAGEDTREELRSIVRESVRRSEGSSQEGGSEETAEEEGRTGERSGADEQVTVVGVLAKMGEAFEETGGGQFILSTEDEGNFDLHGKEDELDEIYQQQIQAEVVGRITDEDAQPRVMEVDEVRSA
jgi:hypothetical protein